MLTPLQIYDFKYLLLYYGCFFILLIIFFDAQKLLVLTKYNLFIYLFRFPVLLVTYPRNYCKIQCHEAFPYIQVKNKPYRTSLAYITLERLLLPSSDGAQLILVNQLIFIYLIFVNELISDHEVCYLSQRYISGLEKIQGKCQPFPTFVNFLAVSKIYICFKYRKVNNLVVLKDNLSKYYLMLNVLVMLNVKCIGCIKCICPLKENDPILVSHTKALLLWHFACVVPQGPPSCSAVYIVYMARRFNMQT